MLTRCPNPDCGKIYDLWKESLGKKTRCKQCGQVFKVQKWLPKPTAPKPTPKEGGTDKSVRTVGKKAGRPTQPKAETRKLTTRCPNIECRRKLKVPPDYSGKKARCPQCRTLFTVSRHEPDVEGVKSSKAHFPASPSKAASPLVASRVITRCLNPDCGAEYELPARILGRKVRCRSCGRSFTVEDRSKAVEPLLEPAESHRPERTVPPVFTSARIARPGPTQPFEAQLTSTVMNFSVQCSHCRTVGLVQQQVPFTGESNRLLDWDWKEVEKEEQEDQSPDSGLARRANKFLIASVFTLVILAGLSLLLYLRVAFLNQEIASLEADNLGLTRSLILERKKTRDITPPPQTLPKTNSHYDFRKSIWGQSMGVVESSEPNKADLKEGNTLGYQGKLLNRQVYIFYVFNDDQLTRGRYVLGKKHKVMSDYIKDYSDFNKALVEKYGPPKEDRIIWNNEKYKNDPTKWGLALGAGHVQFDSVWETPDSKIISNLKGGNNNADLSIEYSSLKLRHLIFKEDEKKAWDKF